MRAVRRSVARLAASATVLAVALAAAAGCGDPAKDPESSPATGPAPAPLPSPPPAAPAAPGAPAAREITLQPSVLELSPGIHLLGRTFPNACYVVETSDGLALVDTCLDADATPVIEQMRTAGFDVRRLRCIFLTHVHGDHSLGARRLRELSGARVFAGRGDCEVLRDGAPGDAYFSAFEMPGDVHPTPVDVELAGDEVIDVGDVRFRVIATPGHTPGSVCYLAERGGRRALFTGDVVASLTDDGPMAGPGIYSSYLSPRFRGDAAASAASLRRLLAIPVPDLVLPGHPRADPAPQNPHMTQAQWDALLRGAVAKLDLLLLRRSRDGVRFLDGVPKELAAGLHYWGECNARAVYAVVAADESLCLFGVPDVPDPAAFVRDRCEASGLRARVPRAVVLTSGGAQDTAGLGRLVEATGCAVVVPGAAVERVRGLCPEGTEVIGADDLAARGWFPVETIPVDVPGVPSAAYVVTRGDRVAVISGRCPATVTTARQSRERKARFSTPALREAYRRSLDRLNVVRPDLWLPAVPVNDQNANVYDGDWNRAIEADWATL